MPLDLDKANPDYKYLAGKYTYAKLLWDKDLGCTHMSQCHNVPTRYDPVQEVCSICKAEVVYYPYEEK